MKKILKKYSVLSTGDELAKTGRHIHFLRIHAFANEGFNFTDEESAHFDACRVCRLKVIDALRYRAPLVGRNTMLKAA